MNLLRKRATNSQITSRNSRESDCTVKIAGTASADSYTVGNCQKSGACFNVCVHDADTSCWNQGDVCLSFSYEVPFCLYPQT